MHRGTLPLLGLCCLLGIACGSFGSSADTDTDGTGTEASDTTASSTDPTAASMSGSATSGSTTSGSTTSPTSGETTETSTTTATDGPGSSSEGLTAATDTGDCPFGTEGCLCDVGPQCDDGLDCNDEGICVAPPACRPIDLDPHDDEASATALDPLGCDESMDLGLAGTIEGPQSDWYTFFGNDAFGCPEQPGATLTADEPLEVCVFIECENGGALEPLECGGDSTEATSPDGRVGCCGTDSAFVGDYDCTGFGGKDVDAYVSVSSDEMVCADYELSYIF